MKGSEIMDNENMYLIKKHDNKYSYISCPNYNVEYGNDEYIGYDFKCKINNNNVFFIIENYKAKLNFL